MVEDNIAVQGPMGKVAGAAWKTGYLGPNLLLTEGGQDW